MVIGHLLRLLKVLGHDWAVRKAYVRWWRDNQRLVDLRNIIPIREGSWNRQHALDDGLRKLR